ncbi:MAG: aminoacetone oxidase family FAD-binding enzyme [Oscillospiraceae bacterium]|nr:aminoacetone oxidase family FAD-binding enzyme [Oscillospiraceae bacterium]
MNNPSVVVIIGAGASGMMAALTAAGTPGRKVILLERQQRVGKKLLATGNGRCNLTNLNALPGAYFGTDAAFSDHALRLFGPEDTLRFFSELGLLTVTEPDGRVYPLSDSANSVLDVLRYALEHAGVEIRCASPAERITPNQNGRGFLIHCPEDRIRADAVILACGGAAGSKLGGVTDGYRLGKAFGHKRSPLFPSLTRIRTEPAFPRSLKGIRVQAFLQLTHGTELLAFGEGEVQFTETGISGPAGFDLSRAVSTGPEGQQLHLRLLPCSEDAVRELLLNRIRSLPELNASELFTGMLHNRLGRILVKTAGISAEKPLSDLTEQELNAVVKACSDLVLPVQGVDGFDTAQVTAGGLLTAGFSPETLESLLVPGLFACGEVLDIDGPCGGYNLQWAWASGALAGRLGE